MHGFVSVPLVYISVSMLAPYCLDDCSFVVSSEVRKVDSFSSILLSQDALAIQDLLCFHMYCEIFCSHSVKNAIGNLIGITMNLYTAFGSIVTYTILILPTQEHGMSVHLFMSFFISVILSSVQSLSRV